MKVRKNTDGLYVADCRARGKGPQLVFRRKADAEEALDRFKSRLREERAEVEGKTCEEAAEAFLKDCKLNDMSQGSIGYYERVIKYSVLKYVSGPIAAVDVGVLKAFRSSPPHSMGEANATLPFDLLCRMLDIAHSSGWIGVHPVDELPEVRRRKSYNGKKGREVLHMPSRPEWLLCLNRSAGLLHLMMRLAMTAGLRIGEIMALVWDDIRFDQRCICITATHQTRGTRRKDGSRTKTVTSERLVPMDATLMGLLVSLKKEVRPRGTDRVCRDAEGNGLTMGKAAHMLHQFLLDNGIVRARASGKLVGAFGWHSFRHVFVARWIARQVPITKLMRWIGHKKPSTTIRTYGVLLRDRAAWNASNTAGAPRPQAGQVA